MYLEIIMHESLTLAEKLGLPLKSTQKLSMSKTSLSIDVPDGVGTKDNLGTYKPWFNGMKHFYTVKPLPPKPKKLS